MSEIIHRIALRPQSAKSCSIYLQRCKGPPIKQRITRILYVQIIYSCRHFSLIQKLRILITIITFYRINFYTTTTCTTIETDSCFHRCEAQRIYNFFLFFKIGFFAESFLSNLVDVELDFNFFVCHGFFVEEGDFFFFCDFCMVQVVQEHFKRFFSNSTIFQFKPFLYQSCYIFR